MGRTSIKVTTHSSSKSLDFLCKYFMLQLPQFFGYEKKFQTIQEVTRRGRHRFTLKMLLRSAAIICCGGVIICCSWGGALRDDMMNIGTIRKLMGGRGSAKKYSRKGKLNEKNLCTPSNAKNIGAIAKKKSLCVCRRKYRLDNSRKYLRWWNSMQC